MKKKIRQDANEWVANEEPTSLNSLITSVKEYTEVNGNATSYRMNGIKANARALVEQKVDIVINNLKLTILGQIYDNMLLTTDRRYKHYKSKENRTILKDGLPLQR